VAGSASRRVTANGSGTLGWHFARYPGAEDSEARCSCNSGCTGGCLKVLRRPHDGGTRLCGAHRRTGRTWGIAHRVVGQLLPMSKNTLKALTQDLRMVDCTAGTIKNVWCSISGRQGKVSLLLTILLQNLHRETLKAGRAGAATHVAPAGVEHSAQEFAIDWLGHRALQRILAALTTKVQGPVLYLQSGHGSQNAAQNYMVPKEPSVWYENFAALICERFSLRTRWRFGVRNCNGCGGWLGFLSMTVWV
jgi:hypothetical protein